MCRIKTKKITGREKKQVWTTEEIDTIIREWENGLTYVNISKVLNRTKSAIECKVKYLKSHGYILARPINYHLKHDHFEFAKFWNNAKNIEEVKEKYPDINVRSYARQIKYHKGLKFKKLFKFRKLYFTLLDELFERFMSKKIITVNGCWELDKTIKKSPGGYYRTALEGKSHFLHRLSFAFYKNCKYLLPSTYMVCHVCNNSSCWNPEHLKIGDALENSLDKYENVA